MSENRPVVIEKPLSPREEMKLAELERIIEKDFAAFLRVGRALVEINELRLYRTEDGRTFKEYCKEIWDLSKSRAHQLMDAVVVYDQLSSRLEWNSAVDCDQNEMSTNCGHFENAKNILSTNGGQNVLPANERQIRPLIKFKDNPQQLSSVWETASRLAKNSNKKPTAAIVKRVVKDYLGENINKTVRKAQEKGRGDASPAFMAAFNKFSEQIIAERKGGYKATSRNFIIQALDQLRAEIAEDGDAIDETVFHGGGSDMNKLEKAGFTLFRMDRASKTIRTRSEKGGWAVYEDPERGEVGKGLPYNTLKEMETAFKRILENDMHLRG